RCEEGRQEGRAQDNQAQDEEEVARPGPGGLRSAGPPAGLLPATISEADRKRLLAEVRALAGAPLQKLWLPSAQVCVLQLRLPGRNELAVLDARLGIAALA